jgi:hypothetical protein
LTDTGITGAGVNRLSVAEADWVVSAWLVAVIVTDSCVEIVAGAEYRPDELIVPVPAGLIVQVTAVLLVLFTIAVNCRVCPLFRVALGGVMLTATGGIRVTVAENDVDEAPKVVAVMGTVCCDEMLFGAV